MAESLGGGLICHPATMTHAAVAAEVKSWGSAMDWCVCRWVVNSADLIADLDQALTLAVSAQPADVLLAGHDLGHPLPDSTHAVSVALPRWRDVIAYEENDPRAATNCKRSIHASDSILVAALAKTLTGAVLPWIRAQPPSEEAAHCALEHCKRLQPSSSSQVVRAGAACLIVDTSATLPQGVLAARRPGSQFPAGRHRSGAGNGPQPRRWPRGPHHPSPTAGRHLWL